MNQEELDKMYMQRCLQLARQGRALAKPNPMVGAVIVYQGRILGEGYHVRCGQAHAEVNAFASVRPADEPLLSQSTLYVSLEPCCHTGKTPPCADLIIRKHVKRVVCGCIDPFAQVHGRGVQKLRDAGIDVTVGVLGDECRALNRQFNVYNTLERPYILLKWAQTVNGFLDADGKALALSTPFTRMLVHRLRAQYDAILVGRVTDEREHPRLTVREWSGSDPLRLVLRGGITLPRLLADLHQQHVQSLMVEGGAKTLQSFIDAGLWDEIRVETSGLLVSEGTKAPVLPAGLTLLQREMYDGNVVDTFGRGETLDT